MKGLDVYEGCTTISGLIKKTVHGLQDGTEDLNSFQLHSWQWRESTRTPTILPGYNLELTELDTGTCDQGYPSDALFQFVNKITQEEQTLVGVVGAFCTTLANAVALVAERSGTNFLQILVSPSLALHDRVWYPHLFHIIPSSAVYGEAVCSLVEQFGWTRVGVVSDNSMEHSYSALVNMLGGNVAFYPFRGACPIFTEDITKMWRKDCYIVSWPRRSSRNTVFGIQAKSGLATTETHMDSL